jgi:hypothetical protein
MPDFRRLFTLLKVLTCDCFSPSDPESPKKKPENARPLLGEVNYVNYRSRPEHSYSTCGSPFVFLTFPDGFQCVNFEPGEPVPTAAGDEPGELTPVAPRDVNGVSKPIEAKDKGKGKADD